ncbi:hypothetical protein BG005_000324 [Podila minutissima]|nr:hypothetical protein BG005_000324 [Podila minutissima]
MAYNILFLGETQSGKSTLIEHLRQYADASYNINKDNIGDGIFSLTKGATTTTIHTDLPSYFVTNKAGEQVDHRDFLKDDQGDYVDELNERKKYRLERGEPTFTTATFNLIDTPGLNDTAMFDETNIAIIFKALESIKTVNLAVITVVNNSLTEELKDALEAYINLLPELKTNIVFVHTKIDYAKLHSQGGLLFAHSLDTKKRRFNTLLADNITKAPHLLIDINFDSKRAIRDCITQNTLREIIAMAKLYQPVRIGTRIGQNPDHNTASHSPWALSRLRHKIVLVGDKGTGKSTLAAMLTQGDLANSAFAPNNTSADSTAVAFVHTGRDWTVVNTYGLHGLEGRGVRGADRAIRALKRALLEARSGCQYLAFVVKAEEIFGNGEGEGRYNGDCHGDGSAPGADKVDTTVEEDEDGDTLCLFKLFCKTFAGAERCFVVVVTHCADHTWWLDRHARQVQRYFGVVPVVCCNFECDPKDPMKHSGKRLEMLARLETQMGKLPRDVAVPRLALERGSRVAGATGTGVGVGGVKDIAVGQGDALDAEKDFEQALGKFLGVGGFIVAVLLNMAKFFHIY